MANLLEVAEIVWRSIYPNATAQSAVKKEEIIAAGITEYAAAMWIFAKEEEAATGFFEIPSQLLTESDPLDVVNNEIDISELQILDSLSHDQSIQDIGGMNCECRYIKSSLNTEKKLCDDDSSGTDKIFYRIGKKIRFPRGTHAQKLSITYANNGSTLDPSTIEVNDYVASKVRDKLYQIYGQKQPADHTENSNSNN